MSIRRKRRQRGKLRVERRILRAEAAKTWAALNWTPAPPPERIIIPLIRNVMPNLIANELVGVQPMASPGIDPIFKFKHRIGDEIETQQTPYQRKKQRKVEAQQRRRMEKALERLKAKNYLC